MTDQSLATTNRSLSFAVIEPEQLARRLKLMIANGKNLSDPEAMALAQYSIATDLNPFTGECYYLPGIGPGPGIAGWRKKAEEQLEYEARKAAEPLARFWCDYIDPEPGEVGVLNVGDIAIKTILHDTLTRNAWERRILSYSIEFTKSGIKEGTLALAKELAGDEPTWSAVGIVRVGENFGGDKMPRYERACKRSEKAAIRKRFPRVNLPEPENFESVDVIDSTYTIPPDPKMSDPAYLRKLDQALGIDLSDPNNAIMPPRTDEQVRRAQGMSEIPPESPVDGPAPCTQPITMTLEEAKKVQVEKVAEGGKKMLIELGEVMKSEKASEQLKFVAEHAADPRKKQAASMILAQMAIDDAANDDHAFDDAIVGETK